METKERKPRGMNLTVHRDGKEYQVRIDRDGTFTVRPKYTHARRATIRTVGELVDYVMGIQDLPIARSEMEIPKPPAAPDPAIQKLELKSRFMARLAASRMTEHKMVQQEMAQ